MYTFDYHWPCKFVVIFRIFVPLVLTVLQFTGVENKARDNIGLQKLSSINARSFLIYQHASGKSALGSEYVRFDYSSDVSM